MITTTTTTAIYNKLSLLLFMLIIATNNNIVDATTKPFGIQSGKMITKSTTEEDRDNSYAGSMIYDESNNIVVLIGSTYGSFWEEENHPLSNHSNCFLSILQLPTTKEEDINTTTTSLHSSDKPTWLYSTILDDEDNNNNSNSVCSTSSDNINLVVNENKTRLFIGGSTEEGGLLTSLRKAGSNRAVQYGIVLDITLDFDKVEETNLTTVKSNLLGGRLFHSTTVQSVQAIAASDNFVYVVSEVSDSADLNPSFQQRNNNSMPNLLQTDKYYGPDSEIFLRLEQLPIQNNTNNSDGSLKETLDRHTWTKEMGVGGEMRVAGLELLPSSNTLVMIYSTINEQRFGDDDFLDDDDLSLDDEDTDTDRDNHLYSSWDGFVTLFDAKSGAVKDTIRIQSQRNQLDIIKGYCRGPNQESTIFVVGTTTGQINHSRNRERRSRISDYTPPKKRRSAFLSRLSIDEEKANYLNVDWFVEISAAASGELLGLHCAVTNDGKQVYVGGDIIDGAVLEEQYNNNNTNRNNNNNNNDDIWIGQMDTDSIDKNNWNGDNDTTNWNWLIQFGSDDGDEHLSDMKVESDNNLLLYGHTNGSFLRHNKNTDSTDVFVMSLLHKNGQFVDNTANNDQNNDNEYTASGINLSSSEISNNSDYNMKLPSSPLPTSNDDNTALTPGPTPLTTADTTAATTPTTFHNNDDKNIMTPAPIPAAAVAVIEPSENSASSNTIAQPDGSTPTASSITIQTVKEDFEVKEKEDDVLIKDSSPSSVEDYSQRRSITHLIFGDILTVLFLLIILITIALGILFYRQNRTDVTNRKILEEKYSEEIVKFKDDDDINIMRSTYTNNKNGCTTITINTTKVWYPSNSVV